jgi:hypothetical protein
MGFDDRPDDRSVSPQELEGQPFVPLGDGSVPDYVCEHDRGQPALPLRQPIQGIGVAGDKSIVEELTALKRPGTRQSTLGSSNIWKAHSVGWRSFRARC